MKLALEITAMRNYLDEKSYDSRKRLQLKSKSGATKMDLRNRLLVADSFLKKRRSKQVKVLARKQKSSRTLDLRHATEGKVEVQEEEMKEVANWH